jgi:dienelactone hydrolase
MEDTMLSMRLTAMWQIVIMTAVLLASFAGACRASSGAMAARDGGTLGVRAEEVEYEHAGVKLKGYIAMPEGPGPFAGVLVIHEWWGHNAYAQRRARDLASMGYAAFALDMYGQGVLATTPAAAQAQATPLYEDRALMRARAQAGLNVLAGRSEVDKTRLAAIGYCMGGTVALEMARAGIGGEALRGVVAFHAGLKFPDAPAQGGVPAKVLVCHGAADPMVPDADVLDFTKAMTTAKADWQVVSYSGAVHAFTNPDADRAGIPGVAYDAKADARSWGHMRQHLAETIGPPASAKK